MENKKLNVFDKVFVIASDKQLNDIQMTNKSINDNLRKYESTITNKLAKGSFEDSEGNKHEVYVLNETFTMPACYLSKEQDEKYKVVAKKKEKVEQSEVKVQQEKKIVVNSKKSQSNAIVMDSPVDEEEEVEEEEVEEEEVEEEKEKQNDNENVERDENEN